MLFLKQLLVAISFVPPKSVPVHCQDPLSTEQKNHRIHNATPATAHFSPFLLLLPLDTDRSSWHPASLKWYLPEQIQLLFRFLLPALPDVPVHHPPVLLLPAIIGESDSRILTLLSNRKCDQHLYVSRSMHRSAGYGDISEMARRDTFPQHFHWCFHHQ